MTPEDKQHFDEVIAKAVQSGKKETSGLVDLIMHKLEGHIETSINKNVNGKIDKIKIKIDEYIKDDNVWKEKAQPVLQMGENVQGFGKVSLYIVGFVASVAGTIILIINWINGE